MTAIVYFLGFVAIKSKIVFITENEIKSLRLYYKYETIRKLGIEKHFSLRTSTWVDITMIWIDQTFREFCTEDETHTKGWRYFNIMYMYTWTGDNLNNTIQIENLVLHNGYWNNRKLLFFTIQFNSNYFTQTANVTVHEVQNR